MAFQSSEWSMHIPETAVRRSWRATSMGIRCKRVVDGSADEEVMEPILALLSVERILLGDRVVVDSGLCAVKSHTQICATMGSWEERE